MKFEEMINQVICGDCLEVMKDIPDNSIDTIITDPPAGISFMSKTWDSYTTDLPNPDFLNWFAGFVDGEGCFSIHKKNINGIETYDCQFSISLRADDRPILEEIHRTLKIGTLSNKTAHKTGDDNPKARYSISSKSDCVRLAEILRAAPLRAKKALDFELWLEGLREWITHKPKEWEGLKNAREKLMSSRDYTEYGKTAGSPERRAFISDMTAIFKQALRIAKPGATTLVWAIPRTSHWTATAIENAGWEVRDVITHLFGQGFPKAQDLGKNVEKLKVGGIKNLKQIGSKRGIKVETGTQGFSYNKEYVPGKCMGGSQIQGQIPVYEITNKWNGWKSHGLKPASEHWIMAVKPNEGTYAQNALKWGVSGLNIDGGRIGTKPRLTGTKKNGEEIKAIPSSFKGSGTRNLQTSYDERMKESNLGRFPANLILSCECDEVVDNKHTNPECSCYMLDEQSGVSKSSNNKWHGENNAPLYGKYNKGIRQSTFSDTGGASRFFYQAKASKSERNRGCEGLEEKQYSHDGREKEIENPYQRNKSVATNNHPTVKPIKLMEYLCTLTKTPTGGIVLDPFAGSGSTCIAALNTGRKFIGIEQNLEYVKIAEARIKNIPPKLL
jgi:site-specific DNA-methyltransferase (adenine-specific)